MPNSEFWYYEHNGAQCGPVELEGLKAAVALGTLTPKSRVWNKSLNAWIPAADTELRFLWPEVPPPIPTGNQSTAEPLVALAAPPMPSAATGSSPEAAKSGLFAEYCTWNRRLRRGPYCLRVVAVVWVFVGLTFVPYSKPAVTACIVVACVYLLVAATGRRFKDLGASPVWSLFFTLPLPMLAIPLGLALLCLVLLPGKEEPNRYGSRNRT